MTVSYRTVFTGICPVDGSSDVYELTVTCEDRWLPVETILEAITTVTEKPAYQEQITEDLRALLPGSIVETVGVHSGVTTTVLCDE